MDRSAKLPVSRDAAAKNFDPQRWRQYVRLACLEIAAGRVAAAGAAYNTDELAASAARLENFVLSD